MVPIADLWLPILVATVLVFVASTLVWMVLPHHKSDARRLPDEASAAETLGKQGLKPGLYRFPWANSMAEMKDPAFVLEDVDQLVAERRFASRSQAIETAVSRRSSRDSQGHGWHVSAPSWIPAKRRRWARGGWREAQPHGPNTEGRDPVGRPQSGSRQ